MEIMREYIDTSISNMKNDIVTGVIDGVKNSIVSSVKWLSLVIIDSSYTICLTVAIVGLIFYIAGYKKAAKAVTLSLIVFFVLQAIKAVIA